MDYNIVNITNIARSIILLIGGLVPILFPEKTYKFQKFLVGKLHIKYNVDRDRKYYLHFGIILIIISIILFVFSVTN